VRPAERVPQLPLCGKCVPRADTPLLIVIYCIVQLQYRFRCGLHRPPCAQRGVLSSGDRLTSEKVEMYSGGYGAIDHYGMLYLALHVSRHSLAEAFFVRVPSAYGSLPKLPVPDYFPRNSRNNIAFRVYRDISPAAQNCVEYV
jgi:hypothetical protein